MARVQNMNVILDVNDEEVQYYLTKGFNVVDVDGTVLQTSLPQDVLTLQSLYREHLTRISELESEVARLTAELTAVKKPAKKSAKATTGE